MSLMKFKMLIKQSCSRDEETKACNNNRSPFIPTKPRTQCLQIPHLNFLPLMAVPKLEQPITRNNSPPFEFDFNSLHVPSLLLLPSSQSLLPIKKRKMPSQTPELAVFQTNMINKKRRTIKKLPHIGPILTMPAAIRERIEAMGGTDIVLVIQKILTDTDLNNNHGRLSLPPHKLINQRFLTMEETASLDQNGEENSKKKKGITVRMFDEEFNQSSMCFKNWKIGSQQTFCLMTYWNSFVKKTHLKAGNEVQLWSFRVDHNADEAPSHNDSNLCFILIKIPKPRRIAL